MKTLNLFDTDSIEDMEFEIVKIGKGILVNNYIKLLVYEFNWKEKKKKQGYIELSFLEDEDMKRYKFGDKFKLTKIKE